MESKQHATKQPTGQQRNKKIPGDSLEWKQNYPKSMRQNRAFLRGKFIVIQAYLRKQEKYQINNLNLDLKQ